MAPLDYSKVLIAFNNKSFAEWKASIHNQQALHIISPISVHISVSVPGAHYATFDILNLQKEVLAAMVYDKLIHNTQQILEIACEKKKAFKHELHIFIQQES